MPYKHKDPSSNPQHKSIWNPISPTGSEMAWEGGREGEKEVGEGREEEKEEGLERDRDRLRGLRERV